MPKTEFRARCNQRRAAVNLPITEFMMMMQKIRPQAFQEGKEKISGAKSPRRGQKRPIVPLSNTATRLVLFRDQSLGGLCVNVSTK